MEKIFQYSNLKKISTKNFGYTFSIIFLVISLLPFYMSYLYNLVFFVISLFIFTITRLKPSMLLIPTAIWNKIGLLFGSVVSIILLTLIYSVTILPIKIIMKILNFDVIDKKIDYKRKTYWVKRNSKINSMNKQY